MTKNRGHIFAFVCVRDALEDLSKSSDPDVSFHARAAHHHLMKIGGPPLYNATKARWLGGELTANKEKT